MTQDPATAADDSTGNISEEIPTTSEQMNDWGVSQWSSTTDEIETLKAEIAQLREQVARAQADYSNLVRRNRDENAQIGEWTENKTILKFLPILDNLERALEHTPEEFKSHTWMEGLTSIVRSMQKVIADFGITRINPVGSEVNPDLHDVISQIPNASTTIVAEVEIGYLRNGKALRHSKVIVGDGSIAA